MTEILHLIIEYDVAKDQFHYVECEFSWQGVHEVVEAHIRNQIGTGADGRPPTEREKYRLALQLDVADDLIKVDSDCNNYGLRDGIFMEFLRQLSHPSADKPCLHPVRQGRHEWYTTGEGHSLCRACGATKEEP